MLYFFNDVSIALANCDPNVEDASKCFVMQTTFIIGVEGTVNTDVATFQAYRAIRDDMVNGTYIGIVPNVVALEFVSPLPLIDPTGGDGNNSPDRVDQSDLQRANVSPWTIGFSVASVMGGFVSIMVYARSRRSRHRRHSLLGETTPWMDPENDNVI